MSTDTIQSILVLVGLYFLAISLPSHMAFIYKPEIIRLTDARRYQLAIAIILISQRFLF